ncbi:hypothetical protein HK405_002960 [Cladochytrium tenue]|nr:hypothetical protein HK405_002960 [Cladochytrium tenue]
MSSETTPQARFEWASRIMYTIETLVDGINITAESPDSIISFNSGVIKATASNRSNSSAFFDSATNRSKDLVDETERVAWKLCLDGLTISLRPNDLDDASDASPIMEPEKGHQGSTVAYVMLDAVIQNKSDFDDGAHFGESLTDKGSLVVRLLKVHAVMHPIAFGKVADAILYFSDEFEKTATTKAKDIEAIKTNTERLMKSFGGDNTARSSSIFALEEIQMNVFVSHFGIAIPLLDNSVKDSLVQDLVQDPESLKGMFIDSEGEALPAFLIALRSATFSSNGFRNSEGRLEDLSFQFVQNFDQMKEHCFRSSSYSPRNKFVLQDIHGSVYQHIDGGLGRVSVVGSVTGFQLNVDSQLADYVNSLVAVYSSGMRRFEAFIPKPTSSPAKTEDTEGSSRVELEIDCHLTLYQGTCRLSCRRSRQNSFQVKSPRQTASLLSDSVPAGAGRRLGEPSRAFSIERSRQTSNVSAADSELAEGGEDYTDQLLHLPGVTLTLTGNAIFSGYNLAGHTLDSEDFDGSGQSKKRLNLAMIVNPSENVIHPSILSFVSDLTSKVNLRGAQERPASSVPAAPNENVLARSAQYFITFDLRIRETKISLSCLPTSKVSFNFLLAQADAFASYSPPTPDRRTTLALLSISLQNVSGALRHAFSPEDCLRAEIPEFSANFGWVDSRDDNDNPSSRWETLQFLAVIPEIKAALNIRHLQDFFLFEGLWRMPDRSPSFRKSPSGTSVDAHRLPVESNAATRRAARGTRSNVLDEKLSNLVLAFLRSTHAALRIDSLELAIDLGQAIGKLVATAKDMTAMLDIRSKWAYDRDDESSVESRSLTGSVGGVVFTFDGRLSGDGLIGRSTVSVIVHGRDADGRKGSVLRSIDVSAQLERLEVQLQYQYERILVAHVEPLRVRAVESWDGTFVVSSELSLSLDTCRAILSRKTIPTLMQVLQRVRTIVAEKSRFEVSTTGLSSVAGQVNGGTSAIAGTAAAVASDDHEDEDDADPIQGVLAQIKRLAGEAGRRLRTSVEVQTLLVVLMRFNFRDPDCGQLSLRGARLELDIDLQPGAVVGGSGGGAAGPAVAGQLSSEEAAAAGIALGVPESLTTVAFSDFLVCKCTAAKAVSPAEERAWALRDWFGFLAAQPAKSIVAIPATTASLRLKEGTRMAAGGAEAAAAAVAVLAYSFRAEFSGQIDAALHFGLYKYLQDLVALYQTSLQPPAVTATTGGRAAAARAQQQQDGPVGEEPVGGGGSGGGGSRGGGAAPSESGTDGTDDRALAGRSQPKEGSAGSATGATSAASATAAGPLPPTPAPAVLVRLGELKFDPQLKVTGDATPLEFLEWLGANNKERVPEAVLRAVAAPAAGAMAAALRRRLRAIRVVEDRRAVVVAASAAAGPGRTGGGVGGGGVGGD